MSSSCLDKAVHGDTWLPAAAAIGCMGAQSVSAQSEESVTSSAAEEHTTTMTIEPAEAKEPVAEPSKRPTRSRLGSDFDDEVLRIRSRLQRPWRRRLLDALLDPRSKKVVCWDLVVFSALVYTAVVTPVESAFSRGVSMASLTSRDWKSFGAKLLFAANRLVDLVFVLDMLKNLFLMAQSPNVGPTASAISAVVRDRLKHARNYARTWFPVDLVSVIPFDLIALAAPRSKFASNLWLFRLFRFLRLLKLGHSSRIIQQYQTQHSVSFAKLAICKYVALIFVSAHWMSCIWGLVANLQPSATYTWVDALADLKNVENHPPVFHRHSVSHRYCRGLYYSIYILTGLGLGDITPSTQAECAVSILFILYGGISWAYIIGNVCSIVTTMDVHGITFRQRMDELNFFLQDRNIPRDLRERCRMYFYQSKTQQRVASYAQLEKLMSFGLRAEVAAASNAHWLQQVWYLRDSSHAFIAQLSQELCPYTFSPAETLDVLGTPTLFIMRDGIAARAGKILSKGAVWNADFILEHGDGLDVPPAIALTYVDTITLGRDNLEAVLLDFPFEAGRIKKATVWYLARALLQRQGRTIAAASGQDGRLRKKRSALDMLQGNRRPSHYRLPSPRRWALSPRRAYERARYRWSQGQPTSDGGDTAADLVGIPNAPFLDSKNGPTSRLAAFKSVCFSLPTSPSTGRPSMPIFARSSSNRASHA